MIGYVDDFTIKIYLYFFNDEILNMRGFKSIKITLYQFRTSRFSFTKMATFE